jgi:hypothetical protein
VITYFAAQDVPVFLLALVAKGDRADIAQPERNALRSTLSAIANEYRSGVRQRIRQSRRVT